MKTSLASIQPFLKPGKIALAGASRNEKKFGYQLFNLLKDKGYEVFPVNPNTDRIGNTPCYKDLRSLPPDVKMVVIVTPKNQTASLVGDAISLGFKNLWIQQMSETPEALAILKGSDVNAVVKECLFMHLQPVTGIHKFHRAIRSLFGLMPK
jgi:predicted CoA-binding protein